ncbi:hypothetical protein [Frigoribacterium sp. CFBP 13707]|uniref:hypothetical protein n=1 Tax=Frigoribacterium sp. CFBP 13707 TaxID=2775313 RepID=UPI001780B0AC|nr:hypothetical protein [Frigoribacterium sp. CFBP 13707]MBD8728991.1 hypothetical protein [Frigoribacterium sp. CFBP 13707]
MNSNEVELELDGVMRTLVAAAGRMGENMARMREEQARRAEAVSVQRARETAAQFDQERAMARALVQPTREPAWWERARPEEVAHLYETTAAWKDHDGALAQVHAHMGTVLRERYGIDVDNIGADPRRVAQVIKDRVAEADGVPAEGSTGQERREAEQLLGAADQHDRNAETARGEAAAEQSAGDETPKLNDQTPYVTVNLTAAEAGTLHEALKQTQDRHDRAADPLQYGREYDEEEAHDLVSAAQEQSGIAGRAGDKVDQAMTEHVPAAEPPAIDPQTGRPVGVGPNGEIGAGYVDEHPKANDRDAVIPVTLTEAEASTVRDALGRHKRATQGSIVRLEDRAEGEAPDVDHLRISEAKIDRSTRVGQKLEKAATERTASTADRDSGLNAWNSSDRRDNHAAEMAAQNVAPEAVQAQYGADVSNTKHPRSAVTTTRGVAKARKATTRSIGAQRERGERGR